MPRQNFNPRSPCGERRVHHVGVHRREPNFNPRSPCGERRAGRMGYWGSGTISIHALLAESDWAEGGRPRGLPNFNPRSPCGERRCEAAALAELRGISIHALLAESDGTPLLTLRWPARFQSTLSLRRATGTIGASLGGHRPISIHALLAESDENGWAWRGLQRKFQSTLSLRRATYCAPPPERIQSSFQSTLSLRRATDTVMARGFGGLISIHALLAESDPISRLPARDPRNFNPRSPCGERPGPGL